MRHSNRTAAAFLAAALFAVPGGTVTGASLDNPTVPTGAGDAIFAIGEGGFLEPVAVRIHGTFVNPGPTDGQPSDKLRMEANASIATNGNHVHVIFGRRAIATVPAKVANGSARSPFHRACTWASPSKRSHHRPSPVTPPQRAAP